ncbi:MAG: gliding motility-associated C-terminal domain-containing protein [Bacteroidia bacterium]|nr:gliding motility-associated C-terminal domain-containing protein [Bacteroidia bacterium]
MRNIASFILTTLMLSSFLGFSQKVSQATPEIKTIPFIENKGQWNPEILFRSGLPAGAIFATKNGWLFNFYDDAPLKTYFSKWHQLNYDRNDEEKNSFTLKGHCYRIEFEGANTSPFIKAEQATGSYFNYFLGNNRRQWATGAKAFETIVYHEMYAHTDVKLYKVNLGVKYDIILHPGADAANIKLAVTGTDSLWLADGKCYLKTSVNTVVEQRPYAYQYINNKLVQVPCVFILNENKIGFVLPADYNHHYDLIIDPLLIFSTYSGSTADNFGHTATYDSQGHLYAGGITSEYLGGSYHTTPGAFQMTFGGGTGFFPCDMSLSKYSKNGDSLLFGTYMGSNGNDFPHSIVCDNNDNLIVLGSSNSRYFPVTLNGYDTTFNLQTDIVVSKFSTDGTQLLGSTFVGGSGVDGQNNRASLAYNYADDYRGDIIYDSKNEYYIATCTQSGNFPTTPKALQKTYGGWQDGVVFKLNTDLSQLLWSTYYGGDSTDAFYSIRLNRDEELFIAGGSSSANFKTTAGVAQSSYQGGRSDGVIIEMTNTGDSLIASSYVGTTGYDQVYFIDVDRKNHIYFTGQTTGSFPIFPATVHNNPNSGQFLMKTNKEINTVIFSTVFGSGQSSPDLSPSAFLVDNCENIYISGWGGSINTGHATGLLQITSNAIQSTTDNEDFYIVVFSPDADSLLYATYFGGNNSGDHVDGGTSRFDKRGIIYQSVCSSCPPGGTPISDFPTSSNAVFKTNVSPRCSNASFKIDLQISNFIEADFSPKPSTGCSPHSVTFQNKSYGGITQVWDFGDGGKDTLRNPVHTYQNPGVYLAKLILIDSASCTIADSMEKIITVLPGAKAEFNYLYDACENKITFINTSKNVLTTDWDLGDGNTDTAFTPKHDYAGAGNYQVKLVVNKGSACADSVTKTLALTSDSIKKVLIPNVFTPNQDLMNDEWYVSGLHPDCDSIEVWIYNRWGQLMFHTTDVSEHWGGTNGKNFECPSGVYYVILDIIRNNGERIKKQGSITLIRERK